MNHLPASYLALLEEESDSEAPVFSSLPCVSHINLSKKPELEKKISIESDSVALPPSNKRSAQSHPLSNQTDSNPSISTTNSQINSKKPTNNTTSKAPTRPTLSQTSTTEFDTDNQTTPSTNSVSITVSKLTILSDSFFTPSNIPPQNPYRSVPTTTGNITPTPSDAEDEGPADDSPISQDAFPVVNSVQNNPYSSQEDFVLLKPYDPPASFVPDNTKDFKPFKPIAANYNLNKLSKKEQQLARTFGSKYLPPEVRLKMKHSKPPPNQDILPPIIYKPLKYIPDPESKNSSGNQARCRDRDEPRPILSVPPTSPIPSLQAIEFVSKLRPNQLKINPYATVPPPQNVIFQHQKPNPYEQASSSQNPYSNQSNQYGSTQPVYTAPAPQNNHNPYSNDHNNTPYHNNPGNPYSKNHSNPYSNDQNPYSNHQQHHSQYQQTAVAKPVLNEVESIGTGRLRVWGMCPSGEEGEKMKAPIIQNEPPASFASANPTPPPPPANLLRMDFTSIIEEKKSITHVEKVVEPEVIAPSLSFLPPSSNLPTLQELQAETKLIRTEEAPVFEHRSFNEVKLKLMTVMEHKHRERTEKEIVALAIDTVRELGGLETKATAEEQIMNLAVKKKVEQTTESIFGVPPSTGCETPKKKSLGAPSLAVKKKLII